MELIVDTLAVSLKGGALSREPLPVSNYFLEPLLLPALLDASEEAV